MSRTVVKEGLEPPQGLMAAVRRLLQPLVRMLIANGVGLPYLVEMLKGIYLEVAARHFPLEGSRMTDSRLSLLTGVHRKDVRRLRGGAEGEETPPRGVSIGARVVGLWSGHGDYLDRQQQPRPLSREGFEALVESVSTDVRPRTLLDEWLRIGWVEVDAAEQIRLCTDAFVPSEAVDELAYYLGRNLHDHMAAGCENVTGASVPHLERAVYYPQLTAGSIAELQALAREEAHRSLQRLNREILTRVERDRGAEGAVHRFAFGLYSYTEAEPSGESAVGEGS